MTRIPRGSFAIRHQTKDVLQVIGVTKSGLVQVLNHCQRKECVSYFNFGLCWHEPDLQTFVESAFKGESLDLIKALKEELR